MQHGMVDLVVARKDLRATLSRIVGILMHPGRAGDLVALDDARTEPATMEIIPPARKDDGKNAKGSADRDRGN